MNLRTSYRCPLVVGRESELAAIHQAVGEATAGRGNYLFLVGEAGSGKTRLLQESREEARRRGMAVLAGSASAVIAPPAFGLLAQVLRSWTRTNSLPVDELQPFALGLHMVLPEWPLPQRDANLSFDQVRLLVLEGALRLLLVTARSTGAVILLDDLQDADPETLQFLYHAASSIQDEPALVVGAIRIPEGSSVEVEVRSLERQGQAKVLDVAPLERSAVAAMLQATLEAPPPGELVADIIAWTKGLPLLIEEVLNAHLAAGTLREEHGSLHWSGGIRAIVPRTILAIVRQKLGRLSSDAQRMASTAAVVGSFEPDLLAEVTGLDPSALSPGLRQGVEAGLFEASGPKLSFRHALIREAIEEALLPVERATLHRRAAAAVAALYPEEPQWLEARAHHLEAVGEYDEAAELLVKAARRSLASHAPASAEAVLRRALELAQAISVADGVRDVLAETLGVLGRWEEALQLDREILARLGYSPDRLTRMARNAISAGRLEEADDLIRRAASAGADQAPLRTLSALLALWRGELETAVRIGREALDLGESTGNAEVMCQALDIIGRASDALGQREDAVVAFRRWAEVAAEANLTSSHVQALMELGNLEYLSSGRPEGLRTARELAQQAGIFTTWVLADLSLLWCLSSWGESREAIALGQEAIELCRRFRLDLLPHALQAAGAAQNLALCGSGEPLIAEAEALAPHDHDVIIQTEEIRADCALRSGRFAAALEHCERGLALIRAAPASAVPSTIPLTKVFALAALGRLKEAGTALEEAKALPSLGRHYAVVFGLQMGEALLSRSAVALERVLAGAGEGTAFHRAVCLVLGAETIGGPQAEGWLREALAFFEKVGAETDAARARQLLRARGATVPRARRPAPSLPPTLRAHGITSRELEVLDLIGTGLTNAEIAERLYLSVRTVESHVTSLLAKLRVENRAALIALSLSLQTTPGQPAPGSTGSP